MNQKEWMQRIAGINPTKQLNESIGGFVSFQPLKEKEENPLYGKGIEDNPWMEDVDKIKVGDWTCEYEYPGFLSWTYKDIDFNDFNIAATPEFDEEDSTPIQVTIDDKVTDDNISVPKGKFKTFKEYAKTMLPYLKKIVDKYIGDDKEMDEKENLGGWDSMNEEVDMNEYDQLLGVIEDLLKSGETEKDILQVVKDTLGMKEGFSSDAQRKAVWASRNEKNEGYMGTDYASSEDMAVDMVKKGFTEDDKVARYVTDDSEDEKGWGNDDNSQFEDDMSEMINHIAKGIGSIGSDYVETTWENLSDIPFDSVKDKVFAELNRVGLLDDPEEISESSYVTDDSDDEKGWGNDEDEYDEDARYAAYQKATDLFKKGVSLMTFHGFEDYAIEDAFNSALNGELDENDDIEGKASGELNWNM